MDVSLTFNSGCIQAGGNVLVDPERLIGIVPSHCALMVMTAPDE